MGRLAAEGRWVICPRFCDYLGLEAVAHSGLGDEVARPSRIVFKLLSECLDVLTQVMRLVHICRSPDLLKQLSLAHQPSGMPDQCQEELPLGRCEVYLSHRWVHALARFELHIASHEICVERFADQVVAQVNSPTSELDGFDQLWLGHASGHSPNSCEELLHTERLGDVVVGTGIKGIHLGRAVHTSREDHDRYLCPRAE